MPSGMNPEEESKFDEGVLGAIDAGLESSAVKPAEPPEIEPESDPIEAEHDHDAPPAPPIDLKEEKKEEIAVDGESDDDGTPVPKEDEPPAASDKKEEEPEKSAEPEKLAEPEKKEAQPSDEFGELEEDVKPATKDRFEKLKTGYNDIHQKLERVSKQNSDWMDTVKSTNATPEQLGDSFEYLSLVNAGTPESLEKAYTIMQSEMKVLAQALGKEAPGFDPLDAHADIKSKYEEGHIDRETALELAGNRAASSLNNRPKPQPKAFSNDDGVNALSQLGSQLRASDPAYDSKLSQINQIVEDVITSGASPSTWASLVEKGYKRIQVAPKPVVQKPAPTPNSIRPGMTGKTGGFNKDPGSIEEAIDLSLQRGY